jgi:hypothetical protein
MDDCAYVVSLVRLSTPEIRSVQVPYIAVGNLVGAARFVTWQLTSPPQ